MEEPTDAEVIARSLGDPAAFAGIYERYATTIYRYALRRVGPTEAEALMAETFRIAFEQRATFDTRAAPRPTVVVRNRDEPRRPPLPHRITPPAGDGAP